MADKEVTTLTFTITLKEPVPMNEHDINYLKDRLCIAMENIEGMFIAEIEVTGEES